MKTSRLRKVSRKRSKELDKYADAVYEYMETQSNCACEICGTTRNLSIHHKKGRSGSLLCNTEYFMTLCLMGSESLLKEKFPDANHSHTGGCHGFVEANKELSREKGWILY